MGLAENRVTIGSPKVNLRRVLGEPTKPNGGVVETSIIRYT